jgi:hypothetical protein
VSCDQHELSRQSETGGRRVLAITVGNKVGVDVPENVK